jgi:hypothetical protein
MPHVLTDEVTGAEPLTDLLAANPTALTGGADRFAGVARRGGASSATAPGMSHIAVRAAADTARRDRPAICPAHFADVARELTTSAMMKFGQLLSFIMEARPTMRKRPLTLQSDAKPMAPELAAKMVTDELGLAPGIF